MYALDVKLVTKIFLVSFLCVEEFLNLFTDQTCRDVIEFPGFVDTMYRETPSELLLDNGFGTKLSIKNEGFVSSSQEPISLNFVSSHFPPWGCRCCILYDRS